MMLRPRHPLVAAIVASVLLITACGSDGTEGSGGTGGTADASAGLPLVVTTTSILSDVVENVVGPDATVESVMPRGVDPHDFEPSASQIATMYGADMVIVNGLGFEEGLADAIDAVRDDGVPVYEVGPDVDPLPFADDGAAEDDDHADEPDDHADDGGDDPHFFTDPERVADGAENIAAALGDEIPALDTPAVAERAAVYADELRAASADMAEQFESIPEADRVLVTNHEVFGYFADRFGFEVIGAVVPSGTTLAEPSSRELADLAETIRDAGVPAIFADSSAPSQLADVLAGEVGAEVGVVELFSESLGDEGSGAETYLEMIQTNADRVTEALS